MFLRQRSVCVYCQTYGLSKTKFDHFESVRVGTTDFYFKISTGCVIQVLETQVKCKQTDIRVGNEVKVTLLDSSVINKPAFVPNSFTFERGTEESCKL